MNKLLLPLLVTAALSAPTISATPIYFNETTPVNALSGSLKGGVFYAQNSLIPAVKKQDETQPHLVSQRDTLVMFKPLTVGVYTPVTLSVLDKQGAELTTLSMNTPDELPKPYGQIEGAEIIQEPASYQKSISSNSELNHISNDSAAFANMITSNSSVLVSVADGAWAPTFTLPQGSEYDGKIVKFSSNAGYPSTVYFNSDSSASLVNNTSLIFKNKDGVWYQNNDVDFARIQYGEGYWSVSVPAKFIQPGISFKFAQNSQEGQLNHVPVGGFTQAFFTTIDVGLLTEPRDKFDFQDVEKYHRDYFHQAPFSQFTVAKYNPLHLTEVMMPDGTLYTQSSSDEGSGHTGDMRQRIVKEFIADSISNANYGVTSSEPSEKGQLFNAGQINVHTSQGLYNNGVVVHGWSGGAGRATLAESIGNEFSHEIGHNWNLGHYPGGRNGSAHRPADEINSTWGWDSEYNTFRPNFDKNQTGLATCFNDVDSSWECIEPFHGYPYYKGSMSGGTLSFPYGNVMTLYTPLALNTMLNYLETKMIFEPSSPTGFMKWDDATQQMLPWHNLIDIQNKVSLPPNEWTSQGITTALSFNDVVEISPANSYWASDIFVPAASQDNVNKVIALSHSAGWTTALYINNQRITLRNGDQYNYKSNGSTWELISELPTEIIERQPDEFGVPVVTLAGFYDPQGKIDSYIYPAMEGSFGYTYASESVDFSSSCGVTVSLENGSEKTYPIHNSNLIYGEMNKFHVNIPASDKPTDVSVACMDEVLASRHLELKEAPELTTSHGEVYGESDISYDLNVVGNTNAVWGESVSLEASMSPSLSGVRYSWEQTSGTPVSFNADSSLLSFETNLLVNQTQSLGFSVSAFDSEGNELDSKSVVVNVTEKSVLPPSMSVTGNTTIDAGQSTILTAVAENIGDTQVIYNWRKVSGHQDLQFTADQQAGEVTLNTSAMPNSDAMIVMEVDAFDTNTGTVLVTEQVTITVNEVSTGGGSNIQEWVPGTVDPENGDIFSWQGSCWEAKNNPGAWETPSSTSWFWTEVECE
ncbi:M66 family metalloprotease [Vibrio sp.]|nr:M66 family metalloprotease [Vibrio sp.]